MFIIAESKISVIFTGAVTFEQWLYIDIEIKNCYNTYTPKGMEVNA